MNQYALKIDQLSKAFNNQIIYKDFSWSIEKGKIIALMGESGGGKTTLLNIIAGIEDYDEGNVFCEQTPSYIFQETRLLPWLTLWENLDYVEDLKSHKAIQRKAEDLLEMTDLLKYKDYYPSQLSGGMKQRLSVIRGFLSEHDLVLMDEPFKGLDAKLKKNIMDDLKKIWKSEEKTILLVTHDYEEALYVTEDVYELVGRPVQIKKVEK